MEHRTHWAIKQINFELHSAGEQSLLELHELKELRMNSYDRARMYKARTKACHDAQIVKKEYVKGKKVLFFNSRLKLFPSKLRSRWSGPYTITEVFPYGAYEISQDGHTSFKVNGRRLKPDYEGFPSDEPIFVNLLDMHHQFDLP
ncbi:uncharacterized protein LOC110694847 [Chenopodium quinoa]|uniref:uncharacterized protein LOC110694847 n=1 Tax=Chenopodium quinoa TaxID=63459 RepID=UPI000B788994|nr:uncharacterized protein LOC110694847 [Chenopodium quinoa]